MKKEIINKMTKRQVFCVTIIGMFMAFIITILLLLFCPSVLPAWFGVF